MKMEYSIVIPVYNEQDNIKPLFDNIKQALSILDKPYEVIAVDDGSTDKSREILMFECSMNHNFRYIGFDQNHGQTAAFDAGFKNAKGDVIITLDADLQVDANDIPLLLKELDQFDAVVGYRKKRNDTIVKRASSYIANSVRNKLSGENIRDTGCPLKVFKREAIINVRLFEGMHRFFPTLVKLEGYSVTEVPVSHYPRQYGSSKYNIRNRVFKSFHDLLAIRWMKKRYMKYKIVEQG